MLERSRMMEDIQEVLFTERQIAVIVERLGKEISRDYADKSLLLVSVLKGSVVFMADLMRSITIPAKIDFMATSSYGSGTTSSGVVKIIKDLDIDLAGYDILLVEDILDSGKTLSYLMELLRDRNPAACASAPCLISRSVGRHRSKPPMWGRRSPTRLSWAMASILTSVIATCPLSAFWSRIFTKKPLIPDFTVCLKPNGKKHDSSF